MPEIALKVQEEREEKEALAKEILACFEAMKVGDEVVKPTVGQLQRLHRASLGGGEQPLVS